MFPSRPVLYRYFAPEQGSPVLFSNSMVHKSPRNNGNVLVPASEHAILTSLYVTIKYNDIVKCHGPPCIAVKNK